MTHAADPGGPKSSRPAVDNSARRSHLARFRRGFGAHVRREPLRLKDLRDGCTGAPRV
jgi:hypothetical protein